MNMAAVNWDSCYRADRSINLHLAARHTGCKVTDEHDRYLTFVEKIRPVTSRQIAALSIATAFALYPPAAAQERKEGE